MVEDDRITGELSLKANDTEWFLLRCTGAENANTDPDAALDETIEYWTDWAHNCDSREDCAFEGPWHDLVVRSELVLKLLTHAESGAIAAAPTTSLPEDIGGVRNWDYRFNWLRDAGFTVQALMNLGTAEEANGYFDWFMDLCQADAPEAIQPLYGLHGDSDLEERELDHFEGYRARGRSGSETKRQNSGNSISTANCYWPLTRCASTVENWTTTNGRGSGISPNTSATSGTSPTRVSGRSAVGTNTSSIRK